MHRIRSRTERLLEILPGACVWCTFICGIIFSFFQPLLVVFYIILFDFYWLLRVLYFVVTLLYGWRHYRQALRIHWFQKLSKSTLPWQKIFHLVFLPMTNEPFEIIDETFRALSTVDYPRDRFIIVLAGEERYKNHFQLVAEKIQEKYGTLFYALLKTLHPSDIPGEMKSKGANLHYAAARARRFIDEHGIAYESVIVSAFDIDTVVHSEYFACLTTTYCTQTEPTRSSYQPVVLYNNNIWSSPAPMRLAAFSTTFWLMTELARPDRLFTFSSHSMSFRALVDVGYWQNNIVSEDSRIFLQCFMHYHGAYRVTPLYIPLSMDTVMADTIGKSLKNLYKQQRRWAWGIEHFPYMVLSFAKDPKIPLRKKIKLVWLQFEGMYTWATAPILIFFLGRLPLSVGGDAFKTTVIAQNAPFILETLLNLSMIGIFATGLLSFFLLPPRPHSHPPHRILTMIGQWVLLPISLIVFSSLPAIDAQTRLMFGKYLGFFVTEKRRV